MSGAALGCISPSAFQQRASGIKEEGAKVRTLCPMESTVKGALSPWTLQGCITPHFPQPLHCPWSQSPGLEHLLESVLLRICYFPEDAHKQNCMLWDGSQQMAWR